MGEENDIHKAENEIKAKTKSMIEEKCNDIESFLKDVAETGVTKISKENRRQLLNIQMRLAMLNIEEEDIIGEDDEEMQFKKDIKGESKQSEAKGAIPKKKKKKYLNISEESDQSDSEATSKNRSKIKKDTKKMRKFEGSGERRSLPSRDSDNSTKATIKKKKRKETSERSESSSSSSETSSSSATESDSEEVEDEEGRRSKKKKKLRAEDYLKIISKRLDNRKAPTCDKFEEDNGQTLKEYLEEFEDYCMENVKGDCKNWIKELQNNLSGELLEAYKQFRKDRLSYPKLKKKLLIWYKETEDTRKEEYKKCFDEISHKKGESLYLYTSRIERAFRLAFPNESIDRNTKLRNKFMETVPSSFRKELKSIIVYDSHSHKTTKWSSIKRDARRKDLEMKSGQSKKEENSESEEEIIINIGHDQPTRVKNRNNQNSYNRPNNYNPRFQQPNNGFRRGQFNNNQRYNFRQPTSPPRPQFRPPHPNPNYNWNQNQHNSHPNSRPHRRNIPECQHCERLGHTIDKCRIRLNLCYICAKPGHDEFNCWYNKNQDQRPPQARTNKNNEEQRNHEQVQHQPVN